MTGQGALADATGVGDPAPLTAVVRPARLANGEGRSISLRDAFGEALLQLAQADPDIVVVDADLSNAVGLTSFPAALPDQYLQVGIAEQNAVGVAAGLATWGYRPVVTSFAAFLTSRSLDQVRVVVAQTGLPVVLVGGHAGLLAGRLGKTHVSMEDLAIMRALPGMTILAPADGVEMRGAIAAALAANRPVYLRSGRDPVPAFFAADHEVVLGAADLLREGDVACLLSTGSITPLAHAAVQLLAEAGHEVAHLHFGTVKPLSGAVVRDVARGRRLVITCEDHSRVGGFGSAVAEILSEEALVPVLRIGTDDVWVDSARNDALLALHRLTPADIAERIAERLTR
ncbi:MAG: transketolase family protein [Actinomycetales bacterium]|nr:transketolase family protein [Actinomycetales bacterium]